MNCIDEYYLDAGSCTVPVQVIWTCIGVFLFFLLFLLILKLPENRVDLGCFINLFANIFCAASPFALTVTEFTYFLIFTKEYEQIILGIVIVIQLALAFVSWQSVVITNVAVNFAVYSYYLLYGRENNANQKIKNKGE